MTDKLCSNKEGQNRSLSKADGEASGRGVEDVDPSAKERLAQLVEEGQSIFAISWSTGIPVEQLAEKLSIELPNYCDEQEIATRLGFYMREFFVLFGKRNGRHKQLRIGGVSLGDIWTKHWDQHISQFSAPNRPLGRIFFTYWWYQQGRDREVIRYCCEELYGRPQLYTKEENALMKEVVRLLEEAYSEYEENREQNGRGR